MASSSRSIMLLGPSAPGYNSRQRYARHNEFQRCSAFERRADIWLCRVRSAAIAAGHPDDRHRDVLRGRAGAEPAALPSSPPLRHNLVLRTDRLPAGMP
jgi:hypothetical protein